MYKKIVIAIMMVFLCLTPIAGADWISFGHDYTHRGYVSDESDFVTNLWTFNFGSQIFSSPAISGDYLYLASSNGQLKSIDMVDGSENWNVDLKSATNATPIVYNDTLYIGSEDSFRAIDINSHKVIWEYSTSSPISSTAYLYENVVYVGCDDGHLYGFDNETGDVKVDVDLDGKLQSSPMVINDTA
ncbi:MAG: PQQ-like beta-propeller repeat protein, partial [Methanobrevibacter sp.]|nr:PQQ-like beta-propeller repeat protein [Methanobrevibacter sp.]